MKQRTFEFCARRERKPTVELPAEVIEELIKHMAAAILEVSRLQGGKSHEGLNAEQ